MLNMAEAISKIKKAGQTNVRAVPMPGQPITGGLYQVEISQSGAWGVVVEGIPQSTASDLVRQATSRVICG